MKRLSVRHSDGVKRWHMLNNGDCDAVLSYLGVEVSKPQKVSKVVQLDSKTAVRATYVDEKLDWDIGLPIANFVNITEYLDIRTF